MTKLSGLAFEEIAVSADDVSARAEILMLSPSILVPCLTYDGTKIWDTLAIGEFLNEIAPAADCCPPTACTAPAALDLRRDSLWLHSLRSALPMNLKAHFSQVSRSGQGARRHRPRHANLARMPHGFRRPLSFWQDLDGGCDVCAGRHALRTYDVTLDETCQAYCDRILERPEMREWIEQAMLEETCSTSLRSNTEPLQTLRTAIGFKGDFGTCPLSACGRPTR